MASANVAMAANATTPDVNADILVEFNNGNWWMMPRELSSPIVEQWRSGETLVSFVWKWHGTRQGSYSLNTDFSRYVIDFTTMTQRNTDNDRTRKVRVVCDLR